MTVAFPPHHTPTIEQQVYQEEGRTVQHFFGSIRRSSIERTGPRTYRLAFRMRSSKLIRVVLEVHPVSSSNDPVMFEDLSGYIRWLHHRRRLKLTPLSH